VPAAQLRRWNRIFAIDRRILGCFSRRIGKKPAKEHQKAQLDIMQTCRTYLKSAGASLIEMAPSSK
jgi:hypothetical protein